MTVVVVKFKGGPESMQKGFDAVNNAIAALGPAQPAHQQRVVVTRTPAQIQPPPAQNGHIIDAEMEEPKANGAEESEPAAPAAASPAAPVALRINWRIAPGCASVRKTCNVL